MMKICFVGFGNMAQAIAQRLIQIPDIRIFASSPSLPIGKNGDGIETHSDNCILIQNSDIVILAVKPQQAMDVLKQIGRVLNKNTLLLSVVTGFNLSSLSINLPAQHPIIRSMPNLPISVGMGATPLIANDYVTVEQRNLTQQLFEYAGIVTWLENEKDMDLLTALSGSGPAYLFYFLEAMITTGEKLGLNKQIVKQFVLQTAAGALKLANTSELDLTQLRKKITSPAGTTAAAIAVFEKKEMDTLIFEAIDAAFQRAQELGLLTKKDR